MKTRSDNESIVVYCDGACSGNQFSDNRGGWGAILLYKGARKELYGGERNTTNQRMELTACIRALEAITRADLPVDLYSDSAYLINCMKEKWYERWVRTNWKTAGKKRVENRDLWERLLGFLDTLQIRFHKVAGHNGIELNERADELARQGIEEVE